MISDRLRKRQLRASSVLEVIESMQSKSEYNAETLETLAKKLDAMAFIGGVMPGEELMEKWQINEPFEVAELLNDLNHMIKTLYKLSDTGYYLDYIFNAGTSINEDVKRLGMTDEWLMELADKFEALRSVLYGNSVDWDNVSILLMRNAAYSTREDNLRLEDRNRTLEAELRQVAVK